MLKVRVQYCVLGSVFAFFVVFLFPEAFSRSSPSSFFSDIQNLSASSFILGTLSTPGIEVTSPTSRLRKHFPISGPIHWSELTDTMQDEFRTSTPKCRRNSKHVIHGRFIDGRIFSANKDQVANVLRGHVEWRKENGTEELYWDKKGVQECVKQAKKGVEVGTDQYPNSAQQFYKALEKYPIEGMDVLVGGSVSPWLECILLAFNAKTVTTMDYQLPRYNGDDLNFVHVPDLMQSDRKFDAIMSFSSIEHDGLGRYGDPLDPYGDYKAMHEFGQVLKEGGLLYLAVPMGKGVTLFNSHRIYGICRFQKLIEKWKVLFVVGPKFQDMTHDFWEDGNDWKNQPLVVLARKRNNSEVSWKTLEDKINRS